MWIVLSFAQYKKTDLQMKKFFALRTSHLSVITPFLRYSPVSFLLFLFSLSVHFVFGQTSFILRSNIPDDSLTATQTSKKQVFENLATTSNVNVVELGNFLSCQNNGVVCINLPEVIDTVKFKVKFVESSLNGDFH
jgi:hypothetical protein